MVLHGLWSFLEILGALGTDNRGVHSEELANPWMAQMLLAGGWDSWFELRYRPFCGGCAVQGTLAVPLLAVFGPTTAAWKLIPWSFHLLAVGTATALSRRLFGPVAACLTAACWLAAPHGIREQAATGWGNHAEVMGLVFGALLLLTARRPRWLLGGLLIGASLWFARSAALVLPAALWLLAREVAASDRVAASLRTRARPALFAAAGLGLGLLPFALDAAVLPPSRSPLQGTQGLASLPTAASDLARWLLASDLSGWFWTSPPPPLTHAAEAYGAGLLALTVASTWALARHRAPPRAPRRAPLEREPPPLRRPADFVGLDAWTAWVPGLLVLGWTGGMLLHHDNWIDLARARPLQAFELRYFFPLFASLTLLVGATATAPRWLRRAAWLVPALGLLLRIDAWTPPRFDRVRELLPAGQGRDPRFEHVPLSDAAALLRSRANDPAPIRRRHVQVLTQRWVQLAHDRLEDRAIAGGLPRDEARRLRLGQPSGEIPDGFHRLEVSAGGPMELPEVIALLNALDDADERGAAWTELLLGCPPRAAPGATAPSARILQLRAGLPPPLQAELDELLRQQGVAVLDYLVQPPE